MAQAAASEYSVPALEGTALKETCAGHSRPAVVKSAAVSVVAVGTVTVMVAAGMTVTGEQWRLLQTVHIFICLFFFEVYNKKNKKQQFSLFFLKSV